MAERVEVHVEICMTELVGRLWMWTLMSVVLCVVVSSDGCRGKYSPTIKYTMRYSPFSRLYFIRCTYRVR